MLKKQLLNFVDWGFPEGPVIKTLHFHCKGVDWIPGQGTKAPHATMKPKKTLLIFINTPLMVLEDIQVIFLLHELLPTSEFKYTLPHPLTPPRAGCWVNCGHIQPRRSLETPDMLPVCLQSVSSHYNVRVTKDRNFCLFSLFTDIFLVPRKMHTVSTQ